MIQNASSQNAVTMRVRVLGVMLLFTVVLGASLLWSQRAAAAPSLVPSVVASTASFCDKSGFFGLKPWYNYMPDSEIGVSKKVIDGKVVVPADKCGIKCFNIFVQANPNDCGEKNSDVPGVVLAVIDNLLRIAGLVAIAFIMIGAFQYVGSRGNSERTAQAQGTIISALTGLAVALVAVAFVAFLGSRLN